MIETLSATLPATSRTVCIGICVIMIGRFALIVEDRDGGKTSNLIGIIVRVWRRVYE